MAKFLYKMQSVLNIKEKQEEEQKMLFVESKNKYEKELFALDEISKTINDLRKDLDISGGSSLAASELKEMYNTFNLYLDNYKRQIEVVDQAKLNFENAKESMKEATIERKAQDKLKEKAFISFIVEENKKEQKIIDELSIRYYNPVG